MASSDAPRTQRHSQNIATITGLHAFIGVFFGVVLLVVSACTRPSDRAQLLSAHEWKVYDQSTLILEVSDAPGPILSTASLPPGAKPAVHPFLSATAKSAVHEDALRKHLVAAKSCRELIESLIANGYRVEATTP